MKGDITSFSDNKPVDVIILSGVVAWQVLSRQESWQLLGKCFRALNRGGLLFGDKLFLSPF